MAMFNTLNQQQQPYIQSGYGAMSKLNTLLGIGGVPSGYRGSAPSAMPSNTGAYRPTPSGGMEQQVSMSPNFGAPPNAPNLPLKHILALRAQNGDTEAQRVLQGMA